MLISSYVNIIENIFEGKSKGILDSNRVNHVIELLDRLKKKDDVRNVADKAMWYFSSTRLAGRLNGNIQQEEKYSDYLSALAEIIGLYYSKTYKKGGSN